MGDRAGRELSGDLALGLEPGGKTSSAGTVSPSVRVSFAIFVRRASSSSRFSRAVLCTLTGDNGLRTVSTFPIESVVSVEISDKLSELSFSSEDGPFTLIRGRFPVPPLLLQSSLSTGRPRAVVELDIVNAEGGVCDEAPFRAGNVCARVRTSAWLPRFRVRCRPALRYLCGVPLFVPVGIRSSPNSASSGLVNFCSTLKISSCMLGVGESTMGVSPRTLLSLRVERMSRFRVRDDSAFVVSGTGTVVGDGAVAKRVRSNTVVVAEREWNGDFGDARGEAGVRAISGECSMFEFDEIEDVEDRLCERARPIISFVIKSVLLENLVIGVLPLRGDMKGSVTGKRVYAVALEGSEEAQVALAATMESVWVVPSFFGS